MSSAINWLSSRGRLAAIVGVTSAALGVTLVLLWSKAFPAIGIPGTRFIIDSAGLFVVSIMLIPFFVALKVGPRANVLAIDRVYDVLHWTLCFALAILVLLHLPTNFVTLNYFGLSRSLFLLSVTVAIFPLKLGQLRTKMCWALSALCLIVLIVARMETSVAIFTLATLLMAGVCAYISAYGNFPA